MTDGILLAIVYLLCGALAVLRWARHPWAFLRGFVPRHFVSTALVWPFVWLLTATDPDNPYRITRHLAMPRLRNWLLDYGLRHRTNTETM